MSKGIANKVHDMRVGAELTGDYILDTRAEGDFWRVRFWDYDDERHPIGTKSLHKNIIEALEVPELIKLLLCMPFDPVDPLEDHLCRKIAQALPCGPGRELWVGELLAKIPGYETETHCLHVTTPAKSIVFGVNGGDAGILAVLAQIIHGMPINQTWLESMERSMRHKALKIEDET
jgi:hypothetical protein